MALDRRDCCGCTLTKAAFESPPNAAHDDAPNATSCGEQLRTVAAAVVVVDPRAAAAALVEEANMVCDAIAAWGMVTAWRRIRQLGVALFPVYR
jgi:hypothetical protein